MKNRSQRLFGWLAALLITILVITAAAGCGNEKNAVNGQERTTAASLGMTAETTALPDAKEEGLTVDEDGIYTSKEEVALYLHLFGKLPSNYITKKEAESLGWKQKEGRAGQLDAAAPGMSIGGDRFGNYEGLLPDEDGRKYFECDINYVSGNRGAERIIYSNDGLIFYTGDHYNTFEQLYPDEQIK